MSLREELSKLDYKGIGVLLAISVFLGMIYSFFIGNFILALFAMVIAVFGTYFIMSSFFEEEKPVDLLPGERMVLRTLDRGYIMFPQKKGGFFTKESKADLSIYLTTKRIMAMRNSGEKAIDQPLESILDIQPEKRLMTRYLRIRYLEKGKEKDALLFVGDVDLWLERLSGLGVKEAYDIDSLAEKEKKKEFIEDASTLKKKVEKKK